MMEQPDDNRPLRVAFCHPDLGLGGAERLVVDAAIELVQRGHQVDIYTAYYDPNRCFEETRSGAFSVRTAGTWFPRSFIGRAVALCAYIRCILVAFRLAWDSRKNGYDVIFVDQVSAVNPFLKALTSAKILFYCHFPDLLLSHHLSPAHMVYRYPLNWIEEVTTGCADKVLVNSLYTNRIFADTFKKLHQKGILPNVLYPAVHPPTAIELETALASWDTVLPENVVQLVRSGPTFLSINRFERKKNIEVAIDALAALIKKRAAASASSSTPLPLPNLIVSGGYDARLSENVDYLRELGRHAAALDIRTHVLFLPSFTDAQRMALLACCIAVVYTPHQEHFGIVPLEAMAAGRPVVACNSGGPLETVVQGETGFLCKPMGEAFAVAMEELMTPGVAEKMGAAAMVHVRENFSRGAFGEKVNDALLELVGRKMKPN